MTADAKDCGDKAFSVLRCNAVRVGFLLVVSAGLVRGAVCWRSLDQYSADPDAYRAIAETLGVTGIFGLTAESGEVIATAFRPPLYPTVLSWFLMNQHLSNAAVASLHTLLGVFAVLFTYLAALSMLPRNTSFLGPAVAAVLVMVDPLLLQQSTVLMTETLATTIVCLIFWWWSACRNRCHSCVHTEMDVIPMCCLCHHKSSRSISMKPCAVIHGLTHIPELLGIDSDGSC